MTRVPRAVPYLLVATLFAIAGALAGQVLLTGNPMREAELHRALHGRIVLTPQQSARMTALESSFADRTAQLERQAKADDLQLATTIAGEHRFSTRVADAVDRSIATQGQMQKATLEHIFAMRAVLEADQAAYFDAQIRNAHSILLH